jgi:hypothetical protein
MKLKRPNLYIYVPTCLKSNYIWKLKKIFIKTKSEANQKITNDKYR